MASRPTKSNAWSDAATRNAQSVLEDIKAHAFITGSFAGTLPKGVFVSYLRQNLVYLENYATLLEALSKRFVPYRTDAELAGAEQDFALWAKQTRELRDWTVNYIKKLDGGRQVKVRVLPETEAYVKFESKTVDDPSLGVAVSAVLACFWVWDEFGRALRPGATIDGNPFADWVAGMGRQEAFESTRRILSYADALARQGGVEERRRMTAVFLQGCRYELELFKSVMH